MPLRGVYSATKAAVQRLTDAMRIELAPFGVQVGKQRGCAVTQFVSARDATRSLSLRLSPMHTS